MTVIPYDRVYTVVDPKGKIATQSPDATQAITRYLNKEDTKPTDSIRIVVSSTTPSMTRTKL